MNVDNISAVVADLIIEARKRGCQVVERGSGHFQITGGPLLVNYYPESKRRSAYVAGTTARHENVNPAIAVAMAFMPPPIASGQRKAARKGNYKGPKRKLLSIHPYCHWCKHRLSMSGLEPGTRKATMEHKIPLNRGGLDNANNRTLACEECNHARGHEMPELEGNNGNGHHREKESIGTKLNRQNNPN